MHTFESCPDMPRVEAAAAAYLARWGSPAAISRSRAAIYIRAGWGCTVTDEEIDNAIGCGEIAFAVTRSLAVPYHREPGHSAGGSSIGARPVSYATYTTASVDRWAYCRRTYGS